MAGALHHGATRTKYPPAMVTHMVGTTKAELAEQLENDGHTIRVKDDANLIAIEEMGDRRISTFNLPGSWQIAAVLDHGEIHVTK